MDIIQLLRCIPAFVNLPDDEAFIDAVAASKITIAQGKMIVREGAKEASLYVICSGTANVYRSQEPRPFSHYEVKPRRDSSNVILKSISGDENPAAAGQVFDTNKAKLVLTLERGDYFGLLQLVRTSI